MLFAAQKLNSIEYHLMTKLETEADKWRHIFKGIIFGFYFIRGGERTRIFHIQKSKISTLDIF